jgi:predicted ArsR family transcriptional regulator
MPREADSGEYTTGTTEDAVLDAFDEIDEAVVLTSDIATALDCGRETARQRLMSLYEDGRIDRRKKGKLVVWWQLPPETAEERPDRRLRRLSREVDEAIVVGDIVYEDGDTHVLDADETAEVTDDE